MSSILVGGPAGSWRSVGLIREGHSALTISGVTLGVDESLPSGLRSWGFEPPIECEDVDGVPVSRTPLEPASAPDQVLALDHVVVTSPDIERTSAELERATGAPLRRVREAGDDVRQAFHKLGDVVIEIVSARDADRAALWGVVFVVADLDALCGHLGPDVVSAPRDAVQPGRRIATLRSAAGLGVPVALMTPAV